MVTTPADTPVTIPALPTVAIEGLPDDQAPPAVPSARGMLEPTHTAAGPVIKAGETFIVNSFVVLQVPKE